MMVRFAAVLQRGLAGAQRAASTQWRRPMLVAVAAGFALLHWLPGGASLQRVNVVNPGGWVEQTFCIAVDNPQLQTLREAVDASSRPDYRKRTDDYYRAEWEMTAAAFYAHHTRSDTAAPRQELPPATGGTVSQASFEQPAAAAERRDWKAFWEEMRAAAAARMQSLEPPSRVDPIFARLQFAERVPGPRPTSSVFAALCMAAMAFVAVGRWACSPPQRLIPLHARQQLLVPRRWYRQQKSVGDVAGVVTRGRIVEVVAAVMIVALSLAA